jgi:hypothetical protein
VRLGYNLLRFQRRCSESRWFRSRSSTIAMRANSAASFSTLLWLCSLVAMLALSTALARSDVGLDSIYAAGKRPAALYSSLLQLDPRRCQPIIESLNEPFSSPQAADSDLMLASKLQLPWSTRFVGLPDAPESKIQRLDFAPAKVGGRTVTLYRYYVEIPGPGDGRYPINKLIVSTQRPPVGPTSARLDPQVLKTIRGVEISLDEQKLEVANRSVNVAASGNQQSIDSSFLLNVVVVGGRTLILAISAIEADISAPRAADGSVNLYVVELLSVTNIRLVCHFVGR